MNVHAQIPDLSSNDVAVVGMALRVPGAADLASFWSNLKGGIESVRDLDQEEVARAAVAGEPVDSPDYIRRTADLADMEMFDADFFGLSPKEAAIMDPQHRHFLECAWEAIEDAGQAADLASRPVGVFAGCGMGSYFYVNICSNRQLVDQVGRFLLRHTGNDKDFLATRASFSFDLHGPSVNVQTACSTSLVAAHYACQSLISGECDMALAGGVTIELPHRRGYVFQEGEILSPDGHCRPFDHRAAGTIFGSGVGVVVLRRLADAIADGDRIHAVIKGSAVNNDGSGKAGYLAPSVTGQAEAIIEAQGLAGVDAATIGYVECHGTGTAIGDPIEIEALTRAFRQTTQMKGFCAVGSVKSNIGHLDTAAGVVSLIKAALAVKHAEIPPSLGYERPNPSIDFAASPFFVADRLRPWPPTGTPRRAAVNSLGVGGTNAHMIVEEPPARHVARQEAAGAKLILLAARQPKALEAAARRLGAAMAADSGLSLGDVAHTLHAGRRHFAHRAVIAVRDRADALDVLAAPELKRSFQHKALDGAPDAVFLFPGGGAQHPSMAAKLYAGEPAFRSVIDEGLGCLPPEAAAEIRDMWLGEGAGREDAAARFLRPSLQLPAILIVEVALARLWMERGIRPSCLIGHSMGENAAACVAGVMTFREAVGLVRLRGELFDTIEPGGMLSVAIDPDRLASLLPDDLDIASINGPELCVVSGRNEHLARFQEKLAAEGIDATRVQIDIAAHSRMLDGILDPFRAHLRTLDLKAPAIPIISNRDGAVLSAADAMDPEYWTRHLRSTVEFGKGISALAAEGRRVFIEVGPGRTLSSLVKAHGGVDANTVINSLPHAGDASDDHLHFLSAVGRAWAVGLDPDLGDLVGGAQARRVGLPAYPFQRKHYFIEPSAPVRADEAEAAIPRIPDIADWGYKRVWKRTIAEPRTSRAPRSWLVFLDEGGRGAALAARLRDEGQKVATVALGDAFAVRGADEFVLCPEDGRAGYDALVGALAARGEMPGHLLHLWLLTDGEAFRPGSSFFMRNQECGFHSLIHLTQALQAADRAANLELIVATNGMQKVGAEGVPCPAKATVLGPAMVIPKEVPGARVKTVDFAQDTPARRSGWRRRRAAGDPVIDRLWEEIGSEPADEIVAWRGGDRWRLTHGRLPLPPGEAEAPALRPGGVYLFTGGLADLSLALARRIVRDHGARIVLVGRATLPERELWPAICRALPRGDRLRRAVEAMSDIERAGGEVLYVRADVGDADAMSAALAAARQRFGTIDGVFHAAGVVDDGLIEAKSEESIDRVLAPKLYGTDVLRTVLAADPVDLLVLFSSTSTDTAPAGQADYVAANAYLNALAEADADVRGTRTVAVHWGVWTGIGMAARLIDGAGAGDAGATVSAQPPSDSLFERWVEDADGLCWLEAQVAPGTHWMLDEHRLASGLSVMPGTGYVDLVIRAAAAFGLPATGELRDLVFLRPMRFEGDRARVMRVGLRLERGSYRVALMSAAAPDDAFVRHVEATYVPASAIAAPAATRRASPPRWREDRRAQAGTTLRAAQERHLRFGPRWRVLKAASLAAREAAADLELAEPFQGDLDAGTIVHPALFDIATGFAMELVPGYDPETSLWVPASYGRITVRAPLPARIRSHVRLADGRAFGDGYSAFDVEIVDEAGVAVVEVENFVMKRLDGAGLEEGTEAARAAHQVVKPRVSPALARLAAHVRNGITPEEGYQALLRALATGERQPIITSMDLDRLRQQASIGASAEPASANLFARPEIEGDFVAPRNAVEATIAGYWRDLLGVDRVGVEDDFFDIGGHSLIAVRLFRMIRSEFGVDLPMSVLFEAPTVAACAALVAERGGGAGETAGTAVVVPIAGARMTHLVPLSRGAGRADARPLFICAGMFGNVLNLRHLGLHLGRDRPVHALQARGLFGAEAPHETFEEMARDYLAEIRTVQPSGPYLLAGFSGGGLTAYEIAQQLRAEGEEVELLIMLDTPLPAQPPLSARDRLSLRVQDVKNQGAGFVARWIRNKVEWRAHQRRLAAGVGGEGADGEAFHNTAIESAFYRALARYRPAPYEGRVVLYRPKPQVHYRLSGGRRLMENRNIVLHDNGWSSLIPDLDVVEVPGDHDSMVLEPCVRILANRMSAALREPLPAFGPLAAE